MNTPRLATIVPLAAVFALAACDSANQGSLGPTDFSDPQANVGVPPDGQADVEEFEVCKFGTAATFDYTAVDLTGANPDRFGDFTLNSGECYVVAFVGGLGEFVTVTERAATGIQLDRIMLTEVGTGTAADSSVAARTVSGTVSGGAGAGPGGILAEFFNSEIPGGGEGCTPGYWKNHAGAFSHSQGGRNKPSAWQVFAPPDGFNATFGVASSFGGTLIDALNRGGGGENALGRHAVAALLNSAHAGVSYAFTTAQVIALVQSAYTSGDFTGAKDQLASENEQGCPL